MTMHRVMFRAALAAAALLAFAPSAASAQSGVADVVMAGRANGVEVPPHVLQWMRAQGPDAFEFAVAFKPVTERVRARRRAFDMSQLQRPQAAAARAVTTAELQRAGAVLDGTYRIPVLMGLPSDATAPFTTAEYQSRLFGPATGYTITSFYSEMSNGQFDLTGDVIGWVTLPQNSAFYYNNPSQALEIFGQTGLLLQDLLVATDASVNYGLYDNDGPDGVPNSGDDDGYVDAVALMYPGVGRECGGTGIWAHRWQMSGWGIPNYSTNDASAEGGTIRVRDYFVQGGMNCDPNPGIQDIGVVAHEAGHAFGIPDLYDTNQVGNGIGEWGLMGSGNWNVPTSPAHMEAHSKAFLGWIDVVTISADTALTIEPILESRTAYRINTATPGEYFLLENRQRIGSDEFLHGEGLLIWHVDSVRYETGRASNSVNTTANRKGIDLEEADGLNHLDGQGASGRGDAGDVWPGASNRTTFDAASTPGSATNTAGISGIAITGIAEVAGGDISLSITFPEMVTFGDVNDDDEVTLADLDIVMAYTIDATGPDYTRIAIADVDDDGDVDTRDAYIIHAFLAGVATTQFRVGNLGLQ